MGMHHRIILFPGQKAHSMRLVKERLLISICRRPNYTKISVNEFFRVRSRCSKINQCGLSSVDVIQEIAPVRVGLHQSPDKKLSHGEIHDCPPDAISFLLIQT